MKCAKCGLKYGHEKGCFLGDEKFTPQKGCGKMIKDMIDCGNIDSEGNILLCPKCNPPQNQSPQEHSANAIANTEPEGHQNHIPEKAIKGMLSAMEDVKKGNYITVIKGEPEDTQTLSDKIKQLDCKHYHSAYYLLKEDVREAVNKLKEFANIVKNDYYDYRDLLKKIDKIFGEDLTTGSVDVEELSE